MEPTVKPRERGELHLQFQTEDLKFCLSVTATKLFELNGLRMVEEEVWRCHSVLCSPVLSVPPNTRH